MTTLPQEIYDEVIGHLWDDAVTLKAVAISFRALVATAQKLLFSHIVLYSPSLLTSKTAPRFRELLEESPHLGLHVDYLEICGRETPAFSFHAREEALMFCLPLLRRLRALRVGYRMDLRRECLLFAKNQQRNLPQILVDTLQLPSLICVEFRYLPIELLAHCRNLKAICLQDPDNQDLVIHSWVARQHHSKGVDPPTSLEYLQLDYVSVEINGNIHDAGFSMTKLRKLSVRSLDYFDKTYMTGLGEALQECSNALEELEIDEPLISSLNISDFATADPIRWNDLVALRSLRINLEFPTDDAFNVHELAGQHLIWLEHVLNGLKANVGTVLEELMVQDYTDYWDYFTDDIYISAWTRIMNLLSNRNHFPKFRSFIVDAKPSVTQKIQQQIVDHGHRELPYVVRLEPGRLPRKLGRSFLRMVAGRDWQASDI